MLSRLLEEFARAAAAGEDERADQIANVAVQLRDALTSSEVSELLVIMLDSEGATDAFLNDLVEVLTSSPGECPVFAIVDDKRRSSLTLHVEPMGSLIERLNDMLGPDSVALITYDDA